MIFHDSLQISYAEQCSWFGGKHIPVSAISRHWFVISCFRVVTLINHSSGAILNRKFYKCPAGRFFVVVCLCFEIFIGGVGESFFIFIGQKFPRCFTTCSVSWMVFLKPDLLELSLR